MVSISRVKQGQWTHTIYEILTYIAIVCVFLLSHGGFFFEIPMPEFRPDWSGYFKIMRNVYYGEWPSVSIRAPGYIFFVAPVFFAFNSYVAVVIAQSVTMCLASLLLVRGFFRISVVPGVLAGAAMYVVLGRGITLLVNLRVLTDTIYSTTIILMCAFFVHYFVTRRKLYLVLVSAAVGYLILTKPAGHWAVVSLGIFCLAVFLRERSIQHLAYAAVPAIVIIGSLIVYNGVTEGIWKTNAYGGANVAGATWFYWDTSPAYSSKLNDTIRRIHRNKRNCRRWPGRCVKKSDLKVIGESWDPSQLSRAYQNLFGFWKRSWRFGLKEYITSEYKGGRHTAVAAAGDELLALALDAIREKPHIYMRTVVATLYRQWYVFFSDGWYYKPEVYEEIRDKLERFRERKWARDDPYLALGQSFKRFPTPEMRDKIGRTGGKWTDDPLVIRVYRNYFESFHRSLSDNPWFGVAFLPVMVVSGVMCLGTRFRHDGAVIALLITSACFGAGLLVALVELGTVKYAMPTAFIQYLAPALGIILLPRFRDLGNGGRSEARVRGW